MNLQEISISELTLGMYLVALTDQRKKMSVKNPGLLNNQVVLEKLRSKNILQVTIDIDKSDIDDLVETAQTKAPLSQEMIRATSIFTESKAVVNKLLTSLAQGSDIDIEPVNKIADQLVESLLSNCDALQSLSALRTKDAYLLEHSINVAVLMVSFGRHLGFSKAMLKKLMIGGLIHDIGKTQVNIDILNKPARLTASEFEHMKLHQVLSNPLLDTIPNLSPISRDVSTMHHEKLSGSGYPLGLKGDQISLVGRMSAIVDIYDALTAVRVYKAGMSPAQAFKIMNTMAPEELDGDLFRKFMVKMGFFPVGSLVLLSDGMAGLVWESNSDDNKSPVVKTFYSLKYKSHRDVKYVDLAKSKLTIVKGLSAVDFPADIGDYRLH